MNAKYIENLKLNDVVILYVPVCNESYVGFLHGKFVKCKTCTPYTDDRGRTTTILVFSRKIQSEPGDFFSSIQANEMGCDLTSPFVFAEDEFEKMRYDENLRKDFFKNYPRHPNSAFAVSESERECWWQSKHELERMFKLKNPPMYNFSNITVLPAEESADDEDE